MKQHSLKIFSFFFVAGLFSSCSTDDTKFIDDLPNAVVNNDPSGAPPRGLVETWNGHTDQLYRQYFDANVAVYYDDAVERPLEWPHLFMSDAWGYVAPAYGGGYGQDPLYVVFHGEGTDQPYAGTRYADETDNLNLIDIPLNGQEMDAANMDLAIEQIAEIVENSAHGVEGTVASDVWGDTWKEIFKYDVYSKLDMPDEAQRIHDSAIEMSESFPNAETFWFRDWFLPLYEDHGGVTAFNRFFRTASQSYDVDGGAYTQEMNLGEFIHFWSGAVGVDLQPLAEEAFEWTDDINNELRTARAYFPSLDYPFVPTAEIVDLTGDATLTVNKEFWGGATGAEGSLKVVDGDLNSKFLINGFGDDGLWMQQEFPEPRVVNRYSMTSGNDAPDRDPITWMLEGSDDETNWVELDSRVGESFSGRNETNEYKFDNDVAYKYYRINITQTLGGGSLFQLSEWRLKVWRLIDDSSQGGDNGDGNGDTGPVDVTEQATISVSKENDGGAGAAEGSPKLIDGDTETKFLVGDFQSGFWMQQDLPQSEVVNKYTLTSGNDAPGRDPEEWELLGSNDGSTWDVLDTRSDITFDGRNKTQEYSFTNDQEYRYYRISLTSIVEGDGGNFQLSEWRLIRE